MSQLPEDFCRGLALGDGFLKPRRYTGTGARFILRKAFADLV